MEIIECDLIYDNSIYNNMNTNQLETNIIEMKKRITDYEDSNLNQDILLEATFDDLLEGTTAQIKQEIKTRRLDNFRRISHEIKYMRVKLELLSHIYTRKNISKK